MGIKIKTLKIAVTGGAASGKSAVCKFFGEMGLTVISLDAISRELMMPGMPVFSKIIHRFGKEMVCDDGSLDRQTLRILMTQDPVARKDLESIVQPEILKTMNLKMAACEDKNESFVVVEVPLLFECHLEHTFDVSVLVTVDRDIQIRRIMDRDNVAAEDARRLLDIQMPQEEKIKRADIIINNNQSYEILCHETGRVFKILEKRFENKNLISKALDS